MKGSKLPPGISKRQYMAKAKNARAMAGYEPCDRLSCLVQGTTVFGRGSVPAESENRVWFLTRIQA